MEKAREDANQRLINMEQEYGKLDTEREEVLHGFTYFIHSMNTKVINYENPLEEHEKVFREFQLIREKIKLLIGQEKMYCLLGTDIDVAELHAEQKKELILRRGGDFVNCREK